VVIPAGSIVTENSFNGEYCSKSGEISDLGNSELFITLNVVANDVISFARKVSSESTYDFLKFILMVIKLENGQANKSGKL